MKIKIKVNGKQISRAEANKRFGKDNIDERIIVTENAVISGYYEPAVWNDGVEIIIEG